MKYVSEIFGYDSNYHIDNDFRNHYLCPFQGQDTQCDPVNKKSNLTDENGVKLLEHQTGACSCFYKSAGDIAYTPVIICPYRFQEKNENNSIIVFDKIKSFFYPDKNIKFVNEVGLGPYGQADFMIAVMNNKKEIIDFGHCEFQSDATTGTRGIVECVRDFFKGSSIIKDYTYGLNTKATIKGFSLQMIDKGFLFQKLKKPSIWIMQDNLIDKFMKIYNVELEEVTFYDQMSENNIFIIQTKLIKNHDKKKYDLFVDKVFSTNPEKIQDSIANKETVSESFILEAIKKKILKK